ncbi:alcohol dehydrogenase catalytic domain-containing protein, partial [Salmonella enterica subsp. enterica serovar Infantis]
MFVCSEYTIRTLRQGEAFLKMECGGVCHNDLHLKKGEFGDKNRLNLGHEGICGVAEVGPRVTT